MDEVAALARVLASYRIGDELGRGGFGRVYAGHHLGLNRPVAIKVLAPWYAADAAIRARFVQEARVLALLDHRHVVRVYDYVEDGDVCALVMEHLGGGTLRPAARATMTPAETCAVGAAMCAALDHAHHHGITHRDVKPDNVMFTGAGRLKLTDFGLAKMISGDSAQSALGLIGTASYMAPEQPAGEVVGPPADIYATGLVLYELLAGTLPFPNDGDPLRVASVRLLCEPRPLLEVAPHVPQELADVIMKALRREPDRRHRSAEAFGIALVQAAVPAFGAGWIERFQGQLEDLGPIWDAARRPRGEVGEDESTPPPRERIVDEDVRFSVYRPRSVAPEQWYELLAFAHKTEPTEDESGRCVDPVLQVRKEVAEHLGAKAPSYRASAADSELPLVPGSHLVFVPAAAGSSSSPPSGRSRGTSRSTRRSSASGPGGTWPAIGPKGASASTSVPCSSLRSGSASR